MNNATDGVVLASARMREARARVKGVGRSRSVTPEFQPAQSEFPETDTLSRHQFLKQLQTEKRRSDRINSPLSLIVVRVDAERGAGHAVIHEVLDRLGGSKRETDVLGYTAKDRIGLLLPHTNVLGAQAFMNSVAPQLAHLPISMSTATYPDHLFNTLITEATAGRASQVSDTLELFVGDTGQRSVVSDFLKRAVDIVGAIAALVLFSPFMLVAAIAVAVTSPGPVIFRQTRLGRRGTPFVFYKFRSMRADSDDRIHREYVSNLIQGRHAEINQGDADKPLYKMSADPRVTPVGRFIRKTSLDELPQLFNVLKGNMSLVGPRPPLPYEAEKYQPWHLRRVLEVRPGITGLWQVEGRSTTSFDDMVRLDLRYIRHRTLWLDLKILLKTVRVLFGGSGAA